MASPIDASTAIEKLHGQPLADRPLEICLDRLAPTLASAPLASAPNDAPAASSQQLEQDDTHRMSSQVQTYRGTIDNAVIGTSRNL